MALQAVKGALLYPPIIRTTGYTVQLIDATAEKVAMVFQVPKTGTLDKAEFLLGAVTQAPASGLKVSFQDVSLVNGDPDGTVDQYRTVTTGLTANAWVAPGLMTADGTDTGAKRSVTQGDYLAVVVEFAAWATGDSLEIALDSNTADADDHGFPYRDVWLTAWTKSGDAPCVVLKYNDGSYEMIGPVLPISAFATGTFATTSTPDERGNRISLPFAARCIGAWVRADVDAAADVVLYDSDGTTALATASLDSDVRSSTAQRFFVVYFSTAVTLAINTGYRIVLKPTTTTLIGYAEVNVNAAAIMDALPGGQSIYQTQRTDAGAWADTTTKRATMGLLLDQLSDNVGAGGGLLVHPGMAGGARG